MSTPRLDDLLARERAGAPVEFLFFWGHRPAADGRITKSCLSQWWRAGFDLDGDHYRTAEHYMMAAKARLFGDAATAARVLAAEGPDEAKGLGRKVVDYDDAVWRAHRYDIVVRANEAKFGQNPRLAAFLRATGSAELVEASPLDAVWGIGLAADNPDADVPSRWRGLNLLGSR
ncbi:NADAR family protein [Actinokineospora sp.]|uniref:NADAR family protein n=1 Tax=Actinokineospora sp. TaxID=1872133 RepID=UPI0040382FC3